MAAARMAMTNDTSQTNKHQSHPEEKGRAMPCASQNCCGGCQWPALRRPGPSTIYQLWATCVCVWKGGRSGGGGGGGGGGALAKCSRSELASHVQSTLLLDTAVHGYRGLEE